MRWIAGIGEVADRYDALVLDLWGVVHDGVAPYPGVIDCLTRLRAAKIQVVMLSNAPRRAAAAAEAMRRMGITEEHYDAIVTSGEVTRGMLEVPDNSLIAGWGDRFWHLGPPRDRNLFEGLAVREVPLDQAGFILNTGPDDERDPTDATAFDAELRQAVALNLPMLCANPDLEVVRGGVRIICAGLLAERYQAMGGRAVSVGKPDPLVYGPVFALLGAPRSRILAVGDSLRTDMAGARAVGIEHAWVLGGVHSGEADPEGLARAAGLSPNFLMNRFAF
jgi:HAD superfamily hydrolase (TIGR01459 family)